MTQGQIEQARAAVHEALRSFLDDGEIAIAWVLTIDVAGPDNRRYLAHRAGGGADGQDLPMAWTALGMMRSSMQVAERQMSNSESDAELEDEADADGDDDE